jgi:hypothetical protein
MTYYLEKESLRVDYKNAELSDTNSMDTRKPECLIGHMPLTFFFFSFLCYFILSVSSVCVRACVRACVLFYKRTFF